MIIEKLLKFKQKEVKLQRDTKAYDYKYATLEQIQEKIWPILDELKIIAYHYSDWSHVITKLIDTEDQSEIESKIELTTQKAQDKGSEITYYRRYNLLMLLDLETEDDDWKQAQDSNKQTDNKAWFNDKELKILESSIEQMKTKYSTWENFIKENEERYKFSKEMQEKIKALFN